MGTFQGEFGSLTIGGGGLVGNGVGSEVGSGVTGSGVAVIGVTYKVTRTVGEMICPLELSDSNNPLHEVTITRNTSRSPDINILRSVNIICSWILILLK